jgi:hypothetical protein
MLSMLGLSVTSANQSLLVAKDSPLLTAEELQTFLRETILSQQPCNLTLRRYNYPTGQSLSFDAQGAITGNDVVYIERANYKIYGEELPPKNCGFCK